VLSILELGIFGIMDAQLVKMPLCNSLNCLRYCSRLVFQSIMFLL
jgi:hypothetical protein